MNSFDPFLQFTDRAELPHSDMSTTRSGLLSDEKIKISFVLLNLLRNWVYPKFKHLTTPTSSDNRAFTTYYP